MLRMWYGMFVAGALLALFPGPRGAAQTPDPAAEVAAAAAGRRVLACAVEKRGGRGALEAVRDYEAVLVGRVKTGDGTMAEVEVRRKVRFGNPPCLRVEQVVRSGDAEFREVSVLRGDRGQRRTSFSGGPYSKQQVAREWAKLRRSDLGVLRAWLDPKIPVDRVGEDKVGEVATEVIRVRRPGDAACTVDVDPATGRVLRIRWQERSRQGAPPQRLELRFSDFKPLGGIADVPRKAEVHLDGELIQTRVTRSWKVNVGLEAKEFELEEGKG